MSKVRCSVFALLLLVMIAAPVLAQNVGTVRGEVRDANGDPLPGVMIEVDGPLVRGDRSTTTGVNGEFLVTALLPGAVSVTGRLDGFEDETVEDVRVSISQTSTVHMVLQLAATSEEITVTSERPILDVTSNVISTHLTEDFIDDLPTKRSFQDYAAMAKGVTLQGRDQTYGDWRYSVYGSGGVSNSWNMDGLNSSLHDYGGVWFWVNPDTISEVQVLGVGAPAEYGGMSGGAINIVTKSGTNEFDGRLNYYGQFDGLTAEGPKVAGLTGEETGFYRDKFNNYTLALGGALVQDELWYFLSLEYKEDALGEPGSIREFVRPDLWERSALKLDWTFNPSNTLTLSAQYEDYDWQASSDPFLSQDAQTHEFGIRPSFRLGWQSVFSNRTFFEMNLADFDNYDRVASVTGSTEPPFVDYTQPVPTTVGGPRYPYDYGPGMIRTSAKLTHFADDLGGSHEFKFGVQFTDATTKTPQLYPGSGGLYYAKFAESFYWRYTRQQHYYGSDSTSLGLFVDDSWNLGGKTTLNLGVRYDHDNGGIPPYEVLLDHGGGKGNAVFSGDFYPAYDDLVDWKNISPRLGIAHQVGEGERQGVLRVSYGKYFEANNTAMWNGPHPDRPPSMYAFSYYRNGPWYVYRTVADENLIQPDPNMKAPEYDQYALGYEQQLSETLTLGAELVVKRGTNLIGWHILDDGVYEEVPFENPETGETMTLFGIVEEPTRRKGNSPGPGANAPPGARYHQDYEAIFVSLTKRKVGRWGMNASLGWSNSEGFTARNLDQRQAEPFFSSQSGVDPNHHINAEGLLQGDRTWVFAGQVQVDLPWQLRGAGVLKVQDGRPYGLFQRVQLPQGQIDVALTPREDQRRMPGSATLDLGIGRNFSLGGDVSFGVDLQVLNALNEDAWDWWQATAFRDGNLVPSLYQYPRRLMLRLSFDF
jgi:outer membrane receptor protein involved in Fe transport